MSELRTGQGAGDSVLDANSKRQLSDLTDKGFEKQNLAVLADVPASD